MFCNVTLGQIEKTEERYVWFDLSAFVSVREEEAREKEAIEQASGLLCELYCSNKKKSRSNQTLRTLRHGEENCKTIPRCIWEFL